MSTANMARWAHTHNIPLRPRGGASHQTALRTVDEAEALPAVLRKALTSPYARQRLSRFVAARTYPTLTEAARDLGIHQSTLVIQINRLEADLGLPLTSRTRHGHETDPIRETRRRSRPEDPGRGNDTTVRRARRRTDRRDRRAGGQDVSAGLRIGHADVRIGFRAYRVRVGLGLCLR